MKTDESTRQLQERLIGFTELFPANQKATPAIEPGKQPFDDPSSGRFAWFQAVARLLWRLIPLVVLSIEPHMRLVASFIQLPIGWDHDRRLHPSTPTSIRVKSNS